VARHLNNGRSKSSTSFVSVPRWIMRTAAWRQLKPIDRNVWIEAAFIYDGRNNGRLALSSRSLADRIGGVAHPTVARSLRTLQTYGFLKITKPSSFSTKNRRASEYRLTHLPCDLTGHPATKEFASIGKAHGIITDPHSYPGDTVRSDSYPNDTVEGL
jgi:hypothetical protein